MKATKEETATTSTADLLRSLVGNFVGHLDAVEIESKPGGGLGLAETITLRVHADDTPVTVGAGGRMFKALRTIIQTVGAREDRAVRLMLLEPNVGEQSRFGYPPENPEFRPKVVEALVRKTLDLLLLDEYEVDMYDREGGVMIEVKTSTREQELADALAPYLGSVFNAIGKRQGKDVHLMATPRIELNAKR
jgi:predicted RNA-binding protein YlqC (UPF0109 family)